MHHSWRAEMENVLVVSEKPHDAEQPVVSLDEKPVTLRAVGSSCAPAK
jgi:hypothetical protein